jgi:SAM-dependent methyltransferase
MAESSSPLRIWDGFIPSSPGTPPPMTRPVGRGEEMRPTALTLAERLAVRESLRGPTRSGEPSEPFTLQWFLDIEATRHGRQGYWIPHLLEFTRHAGERVLGVGYGLGTDWVGYARHGATVIASSPSAEHLAVVRRNFELRGLNATFLHASPIALPLEANSVDVACVNGLLHEIPTPGPLVDDLYRVLKPGGKVIVIAPARIDVEFWSRRATLGLVGAYGNLTAMDEPGGPWPPPVAERRFTGRVLKQLFARYTESRIHKRHLRRGDLPHLWRWFPLPLMERLMGRLLIFKAFKPLSAARGENAAA